MMWDLSAAVLGAWAGALQGWVAFHGTTTHGAAIIGGRLGDAYA